jgi:hypothetical protein
MNSSPESDELLQFKSWRNYEIATVDGNNSVEGGAVFDYTTNESNDSNFSYQYIDTTQPMISPDNAQQLLQTTETAELHDLSAVAAPATDQVETQLEILSSIDYFDLSCSGENPEPLLNDNFLGTDLNSFAFNSSGSMTSQPVGSCFNAESMPMFLTSLGDGINYNDIQQHQQLEMQTHSKNSQHQAKLDKKMMAYEKRLARQKERDRKKALKEQNKSKNMQPVTYNLDLNLFSQSGGKPGRKKKDASTTMATMMTTTKGGVELNKSSSNCSLANDLAEFATLNHFSKSSGSQKSSLHTKKAKKADLTTHSSASTSNCTDQFSSVLSPQNAQFNSFSNQGNSCSNIQQLPPPASSENVLQTAGSDMYFTNFCNYQPTDDFSFINQSSNESYF